jgi:hypothetical protein
MAVDKRELPSVLPPKLAGSRWCLAVPPHKQKAKAVAVHDSQMSCSTNSQATAWEHGRLYFESAVCAPQKKRSRMNVGSLAFFFWGVNLKACWTDCLRSPVFGFHRLIKIFCAYRLDALPVCIAFAPCHANRLQHSSARQSTVIFSPLQLLSTSCCLYCYSPALCDPQQFLNPLKSYL